MLKSLWGSRKNCLQTAACQREVQHLAVLFATETAHASSGHSTWSFTSSNLQVTFFERGPRQEAVWEAVQQAVVHFPPLKPHRPITSWKEKKKKMGLMISPTGVTDKGKQSPCGRSPGGHLHKRATSIALEANYQFLSGLSWSADI